MTRFAFAFLLLVFCTLVTHVESQLLLGDTIRSLEDFENFARNVSAGQSYQFKTVKLEVDINLTQKSFLPIGKGDNKGCNAFMGTFNGNNKIITGAVVESSGDAGLFCRLDSATVNDLHLDSTCKFVGHRAGAISVSAGRMRLQGVSSEATVVGVPKGEEGAEVGGLIGIITNATGFYPSVTIESCTSNGTIEYRDVQIMRESNIGGLIGNVKQNSVVTTVHVSNSHSGVLFPSDIKFANIGGMIGGITNNSGIILNVDNFTNSGNMTFNEASTLVAGGMVGEVSTNVYFTADIRNSTNHANISAFLSRPTIVLGGFFGTITKCNKTVVMTDNCTNNGDITNTNNTLGKTHLGGIIGAVFVADPSDFTLFGISNTVNKGALTTSNGTVCGLICHNKNDHSPNVTIQNSINRGSIVGKEAYGITNIFRTLLTNVVNLGAVNGTNDSECIWKTPLPNDSVFVLDSVCKQSIKTARVFAHSSEGLYYTVDTKEDVQELLNGVVVDNAFRMGWTSDLELVALYNVTVTGVENGSTAAVPRARLSTLPLLRQYFTTRFVVTDASTLTVCNASTVVTGDMHVVVATASTIEIVVGPSSDYDKDRIKIDIKEGLKDLGYVIGDVTVRDDNGQFVISVIVADKDSDDLVGALRDCISSSSSSA